MNLPQSELVSFDRIGTHVEEAHWFYEDFIRPLDPSLPSMHLENFSLRIFQRCPQTSHCEPEVLKRAYDQWIGYKKRIPVRGAMLINEALDSVLLVRGYKLSAAWMFPRGKINQGENDLDCAIREVYEETGYNVQEAGLIPKDRALKCFERTIKNQHIKIFVIPNVPMTTHFEPRTRKEIGDIQWYKLTDLLGWSRKRRGEDNSTTSGLPINLKLFLVEPFLPDLNRWLKEQRKQRNRSRNAHKLSPGEPSEIEDALTEEEGITTETAAGPARAYPTPESHEAATRELQRLLKIQPPTQRSQAELPQSGQEKGQALLAMLRQAKNVSPHVQAVAYPSSRLPHTPMDHVYNVAPEPPTPHHPHHHHHAAQIIPPEGYQAPPLGYPSQVDMNDQLRSVLGLTGNASAGAMHQRVEITNQQSTVTTTLEPVTQPNLLHPQPLPRQANHILADAVLHVAPTSHSHHVSGTHQMNLPNTLANSIQPHQQQMMANFRRPPANLDNTKLALLNAFKTESATTKAASIPSAPLQNFAAETHRLGQQLPANPPSLGSPYGLGTASAYSGPNQSQGNVLAPHRSPQAPASFKPQNVSHNQQKALLDIFKQSSVLTPTNHNLQPSLKENGAPRQVGSQPAMGITQSTPSSQAGPLPYGVRSLTDATKQLDNTAHGHHNQKQAMQNNSHIVGGLAADGTGIENKFPATRGDMSRDLLLGSPYSNQAQLALASSPGSLSSIPNPVPRHQEYDPQQVQKLMSLFNKSTVASSDTMAGTLTSKGKDPASYDARLPQAGTHVTSMVATPSIDGRGDANSMSRRGSQQAPISPENERFLLNYLKSVSSGAKQY